MRSLWLLISLLVAGCATTPIPPECKTEYAATIMHCPPPRPKPPASAEQCKKAGGVSVLEDGEYKGCVSRQRAQELLCRMQGRIAC